MITKIKALTCISGLLFTGLLYASPITTAPIAPSTAYAFNGYGINFSPQNYYSATQITKMVGIIDQYHFSLLQLMGDFKDVALSGGSYKNDPNVQNAALFNAIYNSTNIQTVSFVIYNPETKFYALAKSQKISLAQAIRKWLTTSPNPNGNTPAEKGKTIQQICMKKHCNFIIGNELFWVPFTKESGTWAIDKAQLNNYHYHLNNLLSIAYYIHTVGVELKAIGLKNTKVGINSTIGDTNKSARNDGRASLLYRPFMLQSVNSNNVPTYATYTGSISDKQTFPLISKLCQSNIATVNGLVQAGILSKGWQNDSYSKYNQAHISFGDNTSICQYFSKLLANSTEIDLVAPHIYPFWLQNNTINFGLMLPAIYQTYQSIPKNKNAGPDKNIFQIGEMGYPTYPLHYNYAWMNQPRLTSPKTGMLSQQAFVTKILSLFKQKHYLSMIGNNTENAIFFEAFDSASDGSNPGPGCISPNGNFGLFYSVAPALCVGEHGYSVDVDKSTPSEGYLAISHGRGLLEFKKETTGKIAYRYNAKAIGTPSNWTLAPDADQSALSNFFNAVPQNKDVTTIFAKIPNALPILRQLVKDTNAVFLTKSTPQTDSRYSGKLKLQGH